MRRARPHTGYFLSYISPTLMAVFCIDIGNTSAHMGLVDQGKLRLRRDIPTALLCEADPMVAEQISDSLKEAEGLAFASVVPKAAEGLQRIMRNSFPALPLYHLRSDTAAFIGFDYPKPSEVGQDRIANVIAARELCGAPAVVIDMGTATTFDVLTSKGYAGGIIAPGLSLMTEYLHEKTALLPRLDRLELGSASAIGKSTEEAMKIGAHVGFRGMIREMLRCVLLDLEALGEGRASVLTTGGNAIVLPEGWWPDAKHMPDLALLGLDYAFRRCIA